MRVGVGVGRIALVAACLVWLAGCVTTTTSDNPFAKITSADDPPKDPAATDSEATGSITNPGAPPETPVPPTDSPPVTPELLGNDPNDALNIGKKYFRQGSYGLAEKQFRSAVEQHPRDADSWVCLAAAYDRLRRFDLADRAYANAIKIIGRTPEVLNNMGFSYLLRGEYGRARQTLLAAQAKDPKSPYIANNLKLLAASQRKAKAVN